MAIFNESYMEYITESKANKLPDEPSNLYEYLKKVYNPSDFKDLSEEEYRKEN